MRLKTLCIDNRPILTMSVDVEPAVPDAMLTQPWVVHTLRATRLLEDEMKRLAPGFEETRNHMEVDDALAGWLGSDLRGKRLDGRALWDGDRQRITVRHAEGDEIASWQRSFGQALFTEEAELGDREWLVFLVPVSQP